MEPVKISIATKIIGFVFKFKNWIFNMFWVFKNATKIRNNFDKVTAEKPCPICKTGMVYIKKIQGTQPKFVKGTNIQVPIDGKYWFYYKCPNTSCAFKDEVPFHYQSW